MWRFTLLALFSYQTLAIKCYQEYSLNGEFVSGDFVDDPTADVCISGNFKCGVSDKLERYCGDVKEKARVKKTWAVQSSFCQEAQELKGGVIEEYDIKFSCCNTDGCNAANVTEKTLEKGSAAGFVPPSTDGATTGSGTGSGNGTTVGSGSTAGNGTVIGNGTIAANDTTTTLSPTSSPTAPAGNQRSSGQLIQASPLFIGSLVALSFLSILNV